MEYEEWERQVPTSISSDALWKMQVYRLALFASDTAWPDISALARDRRTFSLADQLNRALGSISANIAEGYSRGTGNDRGRFFEYALGSARESRDWYYKARHILAPEVVQARIEVLTRVIRLTLAMLPDQRRQTFREDPASYETTDLAPDIKDLDLNK